MRNLEAILYQIFTANSKEKFVLSEVTSTDFNLLTNPVFPN